MRNTITRMNENDQGNGKLEPFKLLKNNPRHKFNWMVILRAPSHRLKQNTLEIYFIKLLNPFLNNKLDNEICILFRHGVT